MSLPNNLIGIFSTFDFHSDLGGREESFIKLLSFIELYRHSETTEPPSSWQGAGGGVVPTPANTTAVSLQPKAPSAYTTALNDKNTPKMQSTYAYQLKNLVSNYIF